ncbi:MAG TPA: right-handed parallel beta-helix repeat-containing protein [Solirubrobacter sp.]|nr:right-handed parallel beta-helix repeat-containing protein [Solirubrobacter sp.]
MSLRKSLLCVLVASLAVPAVAGAQSYPEPKQPGPVEAPPKGPHKTYTVCASSRCDFKSIQKAVNRARAGDTIRVRNGVYREAVKINGRGKRYLKLIGNRSKPAKVKLLARGKMQNGIFVNDADEVTVDGFMAQGYRSNGFFFTNLNGYTMNHLIARQTGVYGLYAFNTIGGKMLNSEAYYVNDGAFYIGQTPPQAKPVRTVVRNVAGWGSPLGFSATNMRYVTITKSRFYNNALGIAPNALDSEKYPPAEDNVIIDNDIFWNNFNFHQGKPPFAVRSEGTAALAPVGTGVLLLGGRGNRIENNRIFGNYLAGVVAVEGILLAKNPDARALRNNVVQNNAFGLGGTDVNGFDLIYDGNGTNNCFSMTGVTSMFPADGSTFAGCGGTNAFSAAVQTQMIGWTGEGALAAWNKHPHPPKAGYAPLEVFGS